MSGTWVTGASSSTLWCAAGTATTCAAFGAGFIAAAWVVDDLLAAGLAAAGLIPGACGLEEGLAPAFAAGLAAVVFEPCLVVVCELRPVGALFLGIQASLPITRP